MYKKIVTNGHIQRCQKRTIQNKYKKNFDVIHVGTCKNM